jgi:hypothetical protein
MRIVTLPEQYSVRTETVSGYQVLISSYRLWETYYAKAEMALPEIRAWFARAEGSTQAGAEEKVLDEARRVLEQKR